MRGLTLGAVAACCLLASTLVGQQLTVLVIDAEKGQPVRGRRVRVHVWDASPPRARSGYMEVKTGADGTARFHIRPPVPFTINVDADGGHWVQCSPFVNKGEEVMRSGVTIENECLKLPKIDSRFPPKPGQIVVFVKRWWVWNPYGH